MSGAGGRFLNEIRAREINASFLYSIEGAWICDPGFVEIPVFRVEISLTGRF
jgi:hypothetical protein